MANIPELKDGLKGLCYKSAKRVCHGEFEYKGQYEFFKKLPSKPNEFSPCPEDASEEFLRELAFFFIVKPITC